MVEVKNIRKKVSDGLNVWGGALIIMGILHFVLSSVLWTEWGLILIILGILCSIVKHRATFIPVGMGLIFIGLLNILASENRFWTVSGGLQLYWGVKAIVKFKTYKEKSELDQYQIEIVTEKE